MSTQPSPVIRYYFTNFQYRTSSVTYKFGVISIISLAGVARKSAHFYYLIPVNLPLLFFALKRNSAKSFFSFLSSNRWEERLGVTLVVAFLFAPLRQTPLRFTAARSLLIWS